MAFAHVVPGTRQVRAPGGGVLLHLKIPVFRTYRTSYGKKLSKMRIIPYMVTITESSTGYVRVGA